MLVLHAYLMMPEPRVSGTWQMTCPSNEHWTGTYSSGAGSDIAASYSYDMDMSLESNWKVEFTLPGDAYTRKTLTTLSTAGTLTMPSTCIFRASLMFP